MKTCKSDFVSQLEKDKIVAILRGLSVEESAHTAERLYEAGIRFVEVAYSSFYKEDMEKTVETIQTIRNQYDDLYVGAGTVLNPDMVDAAYDAGAEFILSPNLDEEVIARTLLHKMYSFPGVFSPTEMFKAFRLGATYVKWFPASTLGTDYLRAVGDPMGYVPVMAVGGINLNNMEQYYEAGASTFGIGSSLANKQLVREGKFDEIFARAEQYVKIAKNLEEKQ